MSVNVLPGEIAFGQCSYVISGIVQHVPPFGGATYMVTEVPLIVLGTFQ
jgi:hypothetical protein